MTDSKMHRHFFDVILEPVSFRLIRSSISADRRSIRCSRRDLRISLLAVPEMLPLGITGLAVTQTATLG
jgi:hypothetical protein